MKTLISLALVVVGLIAVGCGSDSSTNTSTSSFCCGLNMNYYDCPSQTELEKCAKGQGNTCTSRTKACN
jgi:hypothetical protein